MKRIKVLHLIKTLDLGGAELNLFNLVQATSSEDVEAHVGYSSGGVIEKQFKEKGVKLFKYAHAFHKVKSPASILIISRIARYIRRNGIEVVHTHNFSAHVWGAIAAKLSGAKVVEHVHDFRYEKPDLVNKRGVKACHYELAWLFAKFSDIVIVLTRNNRKFLLEHSVCPDEKIRIMLNGIPLDNGRSVNAPSVLRKLQLPEGKRVILSAARISPEKNIGIILDIASRLKEKYNDIFFVIAGDGPLREELERSASERGLDKVVRFIGFYPDVIELLGNTFLFLQPTFLELHSITMLEAMSMRVPVLVSKGVGCNDDFLTDGVNAFLLDPDNADRWCEAISRLLDDAALAKSIADEGRKLVESRCDIKDTVETLEAVYSDLAKERRK